VLALAITASFFPVHLVNQIFQVLVFFKILSMSSLAISALPLLPLSSDNGKKLA